MLINNTLNKHNTAGISVEHDNNNNNLKNNKEKLGGSTHRPADPPQQHQQQSHHVQSFAGQASTTGNNRSDRSTPV